MSEIKKKKKSLLKLLYLDQNQWDLLEKVYHKEKDDPSIEGTLSNILKLVKKERLRIPIDFNRYVETSQREFDKSRKRLTDFMMMISEGYGVLPSLILEEFEIRNYINRKLGLMESNIKEIAIGNTIEYLMVGKPSVSSDKIGKNELEKLNKLLDDYISKPEFIQGVFYKYSPKDDKHREEHVERMEKVRQILFTMKSDKERRDHQTEQNFTLLMRNILKLYKLTNNF